MKKVLDHYIEQFDFAEESDQCMEHINKFVEEATKNHIQNFAQPSAATSKTIFVMVNAVYFKWASMFNEDQNSVEIFYDQGHEPVNVVMVKQLNHFEQGTFCTFYFQLKVLYIIMI